MAQIAVREHKIVNAYFYVVLNIPSNLVKLYKMINQQPYSTVIRWFPILFSEGINVKLVKRKTLYTSFTDRPKPHVPLMRWN